MASGLSLFFPHSLGGPMEIDFHAGGDRPIRGSWTSSMMYNTCFVEDCSVPGRNLLKRPDCALGLYISAPPRHNGQGKQPGRWLRRFHSRPLITREKAWLSFDTGGIQKDYDFLIHSQHNASQRLCSHTSCHGPGSAVRKSHAGYYDPLVVVSLGVNSLGVIHHQGAWEACSHMSTSFFRLPKRENDKHQQHI